MIYGSEGFKTYFSLYEQLIKTTPAHFSASFHSSYSGVTVSERKLIFLKPETIFNELGSRTGLRYH
jgi:hypothetical protein